MGNLHASDADNQWLWLKKEPQGPPLSRPKYVSDLTLVSTDKVCEYTNNRTGKTTYHLKSVCKQYPATCYKCMINVPVGSKCPGCKTFSDKFEQGIWCPKTIANGRRRLPNAFLHELSRSPLLKRFSKATRRRAGAI